LCILHNLTLLNNYLYIVIRNWFRHRVTRDLTCAHKTHNNAVELPKFLTSRSTGFYIRPYIAWKGNGPLMPNWYWAISEVVWNNMCFLCIRFIRCGVIGFIIQFCDAQHTSLISTYLFIILCRYSMRPWSEITANFRMHYVHKKTL